MLAILAPKKNYKYLYGPVSSWRLGISLGIDPISTKGKTCNFDCIYCQLGKTTHLGNERKVFVPTEELLQEIKSLPTDLPIDHLTFSGRGEPTLAKNLGEMIRELKKIRKEKIAVITNSSLMYDREVRDDLLSADFVLAKLDACSQDTFETIDRAIEGMRLDFILDGIKDFRSFFRGKLALQIMFMEENKKYAEKIASIAKTIGPDEVELSTPIRPSAVKPLSPKELSILKEYFKGLSLITVYDKTTEATEPFDTKRTIQRHGHYTMKVE